MRGSDRRSGSLFSYVDLEGRVGRDHPLRQIGTLTAALHRADTPSGFHFTWDGADDVTGDGWAEVQLHGSLFGKISWRNGDEAEFKATHWETASTAR